MKPISYGRHSISEEDIEAVSEVLRSDWLTQGPMGERFEGAVAHYCGAPHAAALCNGTAALYVAYRALGLGRGDLLWTSPITFAATANAALLCGADVDFVDIESETCNMSVAALAQKLSAAAHKGRLPTIVVPVHFAGQPCDMRQIAELAARYRFRVIEDAAHALGARYGDTIVGSCSHSEAAMFSFHPVKSITTGEGGMLMTRSPELHQQFKLLRNHGIAPYPDRMAGRRHGDWHVPQLDLALNFRLTDIQAALGVSQMKRLDALVGRRRELAARYDQLLRGLPLVLPSQRPDSQSAWHLYVVRIDPARAKSGRKQVFDAMRAADIRVQVHYLPVHLHPYYEHLGFKHGDFPVAESYYENAFSLPLHPGLDAADQDRVVSVLANALH
jgi:UDP-4-amino-4,6-dideoxy-N-acetyl-beta-L-altrosamine transaminase